MIGWYPHKGKRFPETVRYEIWKYAKVLANYKLKYYRASESSDVAIGKLPTQSGSFAPCKKVGDQVHWSHSSPGLVGPRHADSC